MTTYHTEAPHLGDSVALFYCVCTGLLRRTRDVGELLIDTCLDAWMRGFIYTLEIVAHLS